MDLDGDGHIDILSGSWPGELFLFRGGPGGTFAAPEMIKNKDGEFINIGGGVQKQEGGRLLIAGNATFEDTAEGKFVNYHGKRYESTPEREVWVTGTASAVHAVDWDGDGDYDLLVGDISGKVSLILNEGNRKAFTFGKERQLEAGGQPLSVEGDAGPFMADWDGDGDLDLLVGAGDGSVKLFLNEGTPGAPKLAAAQALVPAAEVSFGSDAPKEPRRGMRSKVCAVDWNGDGRLDLLVGDFTTQKPNLPEPTAEEKVVHEKLRAELAGVMKRYTDLAGKLYGATPVRDKKEHEKLQAEMTQVVTQMQDLRGKLPPEYDNHGWVWLFLRQGAKANRP